MMSRDRFDESLIKTLSGGEGESVQARYMRQNSFEFEPQCKLWMTGNEIPHISVTNNSFWRRFLMVKFDCQYESEDDNFIDSLLVEKEGIFAEMVRGATRYFAKEDGGLLVPKAVNLAVEEHQEDSDTLGQFLREWTVPEDGAMVRAGELHMAYVKWADAHKIRGVMDVTPFGYAMGNRVEKKRSERGWWYLDLRMMDSVKHVAREDHD